MKVIRESYRAGESWPFFVTLERGEEIRGYFRVNYDALLALSDGLEAQQSNKGLRQMGPYMQPGDAANRIRESLGVE